MVHSSQHEEELMDQALVRFRKAAARETVDGATCDGGIPPRFSIKRFDTG
jgi:hypothetical protein